MFSKPNYDQLIFEGYEPGVLKFVLFLVNVIEETPEEIPFPVEGKHVKETIHVKSSAPFKELSTRFGNIPFNPAYNKKDGDLIVFL